MNFHDISGILKILSGFFDPELSIKEVDVLYKNSTENKETINDESDSDMDDNNDEHDTNDIDKLNMIIKVKQNSECLDILSELISAAVQNRESPGIFFCENDSWEFLSKEISIQDYLSFIYGIVRLCNYDCLDKINRKLSVLSARVYMMLLTIPGAKPLKVFNDDVLIKSINIFDAIQPLRQAVQDMKISKEELTEFQMDLHSFLVELKIVFGHVSLDDYEKVLRVIFSTFTIIIRDSYICNYDSIYAYYLTTKSYKIMEIICTSSREYTDRVLRLAVSSTICLHLFQSQPKFAVDVPIENPAEFDCRITHFVLGLLHKQPTYVIKILENFIQMVITNRDENLTDDDYSLFLDACVTYDSAMDKEYKTTILPYLETSIQSSNSKVRQHTLDLLNKMLTNVIDTDCIARDNVTVSLTKELQIYKIILNSIIDIDTFVKIHALTALLESFKNGNANCKRIFEVAFETTNSVDDSHSLNDDVPSSAEEINSSHDHTNSFNDNINGLDNIFPVKQIDLADELKIDLIEIYIRNLLKNLLYLLNNSSFHLRCIVLEILQILVCQNIKILDNFQFYNYITLLSVDCSPKVRKQLITFINTILDKYPTYENAITIYSECIIEFLKDRDKTILSSAIDSIRTKIFNNLNTYELSQSPVHKSPWLFFRIIFRDDFRGQFYEHMDLLLKHNVVSQKTLSIVETHLTTSNATEAWTITYFLSKKVKSRNPEYIIASFKDVIINPEIVYSLAYDLIFQVMNTWVEDFEKSTLEKIQEMIRDIIHSGSSQAHMMSNLYNFANKAHKLCHGAIDINWINDIYEEAVAYILQNKREFLTAEKMDLKFAQKLYIFSESSSDLLFRPNPEVINFLITFLLKIEEKEIIPFNNNYEEKTCISIIVLTRLLIRDSMLALSAVHRFVALADVVVDSLNITSNLSHAFRDLFVKFGILMECTVKSLTKQILSKYMKIRFQALSFLAEIIMKDLTRMTCNMLFHVFLAIADQEKKISNLGKHLVLSYVEHRNTTMLRECFIDMIFIIYKYTSFTQFTFIPQNEIPNISELYTWPSEIEKTFMFYNFIVEAVDPIEAYNIFKWIKIINTEVLHKNFIKEQAKKPIRDVIYILRKICFNQIREEEKLMNTNKKLFNKNDENDVTDDENDEEKELIKNAKPKESVEQYISIIPNFYENIVKTYPDYQIKLNRLMEAIYVCFQDMIAVPSSFWDPYSEIIQNKTKLSKDHICDGKNNEKLRLVNYITTKEKDPLEAYFYR